MKIFAATVRSVFYASIKTYIRGWVGGDGGGVMTASDPLFKDKGGAGIAGCGQHKESVSAPAEVASTLGDNSFQRYEADVWLCSHRCRRVPALLEDKQHDEN